MGMRSLLQCGFWGWTSDHQACSALPCFLSHHTDSVILYFTLHILEYIHICLIRALELECENMVAGDKNVAQLVRLSLCMRESLSLLPSVA